MSAILQDRFQKIARAMTRNWGINVVPHSTKCSTDGESYIYYPANTSHLSETSQKSIHGLLDHEILHVLEEKRHKKAGLKTPMTFLRSYRTNKEKLAFNVFEDIRVEAGCEQIGMRENIANLNETTNKLFYGKKHKDFWKSLGCAVIDTAHGRSTDWLPAQFRPYLAALADEITDCPSMKCAEDAHHLAVRMLSKVEDVNEAMEEKEDEGSQSDDRCSQPSSETGDSSGEEDGEGCEGSGEEDDDCGGEGEVEDGSVTSNTEGEEASEETGSTANGENVIEEATKELSKEQIRDTVAKARRDASSVDIHDDVKQQIEYESIEDAEVNERYIPNPNALSQDRWVTPNVSGIREKGAYTAERNVVISQIRGMKGKLLNLLRSKTDCTTTSGHKRGKLDKSKLARLIAGSNSVCKQVEVGEDVDTAILELIDLSGSMGSGTREHQKARYAKLVTIGLSETFDALRIPFEVIGFSNVWSATVPVAPGTQRNEPIKYTVFKSFGEKFGKVKLRLNEITGDGNNTDGEAVLAAAERLAARPESRKILIVMSDGQPHGGDVDCRLIDAHLKQVVTQITKCGIEVIAFGVKTDAVEGYYNKETGAYSVVIDDLGKMAIKVYTIMKDVMLNKGR